MRKPKSEVTQVAEATITESTEGQPPPQDSATEGIAKAAYAIAAEELKWKGDFPAWDQVSDRGRVLYVEGATHVQAGNPPRTRYEEIVAEVLHG